MQFSANLYYYRSRYILLCFNALHSRYNVNLPDPYYCFYLFRIGFSLLANYHAKAQNSPLPFPRFIDLF